MKNQRKQSAVEVVESSSDLGGLFRLLAQYAEKLPRESQQHLHIKLRSLAQWIDQALAERR